MDEFALGYIVHRFFYRIWAFFHHWYIDDSRAIAHHFVSTLEEIDKSLAVAITLRYFFQPLYKDYTVIGRILGVIFRTGRILIGVAVYILVTVPFAVFYVIWVALPPFLLFYALRGI
jgi:hypothetical protein